MDIKFTVTIGYRFAVPLSILRFRQNCLFLKKIITMAAIEQRENSKSPILPDEIFFNIMKGERADGGNVKKRGNVSFLPQSRDFRDSYKGREIKKKRYKNRV